MKKRVFGIAMLIVTIIFSATGCGFLSNNSESQNTVEGKGLFVTIETDNANILAAETDCYHYYYLKDTGVVYVGFITKRATDHDFIAPVITENGNYCRYDKEKQKVVEIRK